MHFRRPCEAKPPPTSKLSTPLYSVYIYIAGLVELHVAKVAIDITLQLTEYRNNKGPETKSCGTLDSAGSGNDKTPFSIPQTAFYE